MFYLVKHTSLSVLNEVILSLSRIKYDVQNKNIFQELCPLPIKNAKGIRCD